MRAASISAPDSYRPDIDGLRAIAVVPVVLFHVDANIVPGGFAGVDIFFVISGYLIGAIVDRECRQNSFSLARFYERRVRRIGPALLFMIFGTIMLASSVLSPSEMADLGQSLLATLSFSSNIYFWSRTGYFDTPAASEPLLHTWSLSVEEQYYLLFPLAMMTVYRRWPDRIVPIVVATACCSFIMCCLALGRSDGTGFFLLPCRTWELLLGFGVALSNRSWLKSRRTRQCISAIGLVLIAIAMCSFDAKTPLPGPLTLLPCGGAALLIASGGAGDAIVTAVLRWRPLAFVGLISYPLYLWHWPLIVFQHEYAIIRTGSAILDAVAIIAASGVMALISWSFVEGRSGRGGRTVRRPSVAAIGAVAAMALIVGAGSIATNGYPARFSPTENRMLAVLGYDAASSFRDGICMISSGSRRSDFDTAKCLTMSPSMKNDLLFGDSHAAHLWSGLDIALRPRHVMQATASGCLPLLATAAAEWSECRALASFIYAEFLTHHRIDRVILAARWRPADIARLSSTLDWFRDHKIDIVLIGPIVQYDAPVPRLLATAHRFPDRQVLERHRLTTLVELDRSLELLAQAHGAGYISLWRLMCARPDCLAAQNGVPLQFDYGHVTARGSLAVAKLMAAGGGLD
jgi:peptidoglycan/LPS O-acetylase OafA/YrhL